MKLNYKLLYEENMILKSQLDTVCKKLKEKRKLIEMYSNLLKDKKQQDNTTQADLVCVLCSVLLNYIQHTYKYNYNFITRFQQM